MRAKLFISDIVYVIMLDDLHATLVGKKKNVRVKKGRKHRRKEEKKYEQRNARRMKKVRKEG